MATVYTTAVYSKFSEAIQQLCERMRHNFSLVYSFTFIVSSVFHERKIIIPFWDYRITEFKFWGKLVL